MGKDRNIETKIHKYGDQITDWKISLQYLKEGNIRYVANNVMHSKVDRKALAIGQHPFAVVVTCADSRVSPEIYFDQKLGDIFVIRNAGNISDQSVLGSIEYAVEYLGVPLVVVVGHTNCAAVGASFNKGKYRGNLSYIISKIHSTIKGCSSLGDAINANIRNTVIQIQNDEVIQELETVVMGACYDIESGEVTWLD